MQLVQAQTFTLLYAFTGGVDGGTPLATPLLYDGNVCGTTLSGGTYGNGTVYAVNSMSHLEAPLHSFVGRPDGADPIAGLVQDSEGNFYGVAYRGGEKDYGTVFEVSPAGTFTLLHSLAGPPSEGSGPAGTLVIDPAGALFGTTYFGGGTKGWGTAFEYSGEAYTSIKSFAPGGALPRAGMYLEGGKLYGTSSGDDSEMNAGAVFELGVPDPLYNFTGGTDGGQPMGGVVGDGNGNLYGTASTGGSANFGVGNGVVFELNIASGHETVLYTFTGKPDGATPSAGLAWDSQGNLYGTTTYGGTYGLGTVFELDASGSLTILHSFTGRMDGAYPYAGVVVDSGGNIWGAASAGGMQVSGTGPPVGYGTVFVIYPAAP